MYGFSGFSNVDGDCIMIRKLTNSADSSLNIPEWANDTYT